MRGARIWYRSLAICAFVLGIAALPVPGYAQTGQVKGKVVDASGKPVVGVEVTIAITEGTTRKFTVKTNKNGEYIQIGLQVGQYTISAAKDNMADSKSLRIGLDMAEVNLTLKTGGATAGGGDVSDADRKKAEARNAAVKGAFDAGVAAANAGKADEAVAKFNEVIAQVPKCMECYTNIASVYSDKKEYGKAEEALKKAAEVNPASPEPYNGLMNLYNTTKRLKEAQEMGAEAQKRAGAAGGGAASADMAYSQAVVAWNADDAAKAKEHLDAVIKANPSHAEAHFLLGKVYVKLGAAGDTTKLGDAATEFETYLKLAPTGPNAKEAQANFDGLKSFRK